MNTNHENKTAADPFGDLTKLKVPQNFAESASVRKALIQVLVRKPHKQEFVRVHPDESMRILTAILELKDAQETFLVMPEIAEQLSGEVSTKLLVTAVNRQGVPFLWALNYDGGESTFKKNHWNESALTAASMAQKKWVRVVSNHSQGAYDVYEATATLAEPEWPEQSFKEILKIAFKDNLIDSVDHIAIKRLRGLA